MKKEKLARILKQITVKKIDFVSTRNAKTKVSFWQSVVQGMAPDGGLLVPNRLPALPKSLLNRKEFWQDATVSDISTIIHRLFIPRNEISDHELIQMMARAHDFALPIEKLDPTTWVLRLDQGPTASFKDVAARSLAQLMERYCEIKNIRINIVVATSGDTGVAVADAFGNSRHINVTVLYPSDGVSEVQEKQMLTIHHSYANEQVIPIKGNFDVCQDLAKGLQQARAERNSAVGKIVQTLNLSSANSINVWRLIPQMTQYFVGYATLVKKNIIKPGTEIVYAVPTGNVGHLMAGIYARELGLPIKRFIVATNANNILANIIGSGVIKHRGFVKTSSPSMDILDPSNLERLLHFMSTKIKSKRPIDFAGMKQAIKSTSEEAVDLSKYGITARMISRLQHWLWAEDIETDGEIYAMMRHLFATTGKVLEPHGTTAAIATLRAESKAAIRPTDQVIILETAHPDKFPTALFKASLSVPKPVKHPVLNKLAQVNIKSMGKPRSLAPQALPIAKLMKRLNDRA